MEKQTAPINMRVDKDAYKKIKSIAYMEDKQICDVVSEALIMYVEKRNIKLSPIK